MPFSLGRATHQLPKPARQEFFPSLLCLTHSYAQIESEKQTVAVVSIPQGFKRNIGWEKGSFRNWFGASIPTPICHVLFFPQCFPRFAHVCTLAHTRILAIFVALAFSYTLTQTHIGSYTRAQSWCELMKGVIKEPQWWLEIRGNRYRSQIYTNTDER